MSSPMATLATFGPPRLDESLVLIVLLIRIDHQGVQLLQKFLMLRILKKGYLPFEMAYNNNILLSRIRASFGQLTNEVLVDLMLQLSDFHRGGLFHGSKFL